MKKVLLSLTLFSLAVFAGKAQVTENQVKSEFNKSLVKEQFLNPEKIAFVVTSQTQSKHNGMVHIYANQVVNGMEVLNANADMHFTANGVLIASHHNFIANPETRINQATVKLSAMEALRKALASNGVIESPIHQKSPEIVNGKLSWFEPNISSDKMFVKAGYFAIADQVKLVYQVEFLDDETNDWWNKKIDANTSEVIDQLSYTTHCDFPTSAGSAKAKFSFLPEDNEPSVSLGKKANTGTYNVFPLPLESPNHGPRSLMSNMADPTASPFGWHDTDGVAGPEFLITRGNNVYAKEDTLNNNSITSGYSPNGGDSLIFDYPYSVDAKPRANLNSAIVNLFYWNNILHDIFYKYGFDEENGNYQQKNHTGLGKGKDAVMADAQDGSGTSNANFSAPVDGSSGRMQMYLWPTSAASSTNNTLGVLYPNSVKGVFYGPQSVAGARLSAEGLYGQVVLLKDSGATTSFGCGLLDPNVNLSGKIVLIDRGGTCGTNSTSNRAKIKKAQQAGAIAVIIAHNINGLTPTAVTGTDPSITIPSITIGYGTGVMLKTALQSDSIYVKLFDSSSFNTARIYDSDLDNGVITHEFGHGVSIRLTGGPGNSSCLSNQEQAGEGWSDFFCLALTTRVHEKSATAARGIGTFVIDEDTTGLGIRNYRYSRSMTINPSTYNTAKTLSIPHGVGSVWCTMLYDIYWDMIDKYGFDPDWYNGTGGNNKMMQLVIDGLILQPCNPGFVDARNAIIMADSINNGGANKDLLWKGFARRGLGFYANQGSSASRTDGTESYALPPVTGLSDQLLSEQQFRLYPNPSQTRITIDVFGGAKITGVEIYDLQGKLVQTENTENANLPSATLNIGANPHGYYLVKVKTTEGVAHKKLLIN